MTFTMTLRAWQAFITAARSSLTYAWSPDLSLPMFNTTSSSTTPLSMASFASFTLVRVVVVPWGKPMTVVTSTGLSLSIFFASITSAGRTQTVATLYACANRQPASLSGTVSARLSKERPIIFAISSYVGMMGSLEWLFNQRFDRVQVFNACSLGNSIAASQEKTTVFGNRRNKRTHFRYKGIGFQVREHGAFNAAGKHLSLRPQGAYSSGQVAIACWRRRDIHNAVEQCGSDLVNHHVYMAAHVDQQLFPMVMHNAGIIIQHGNLKLFNPFRR